MLLHAFTRMLPARRETEKGSGSSSDLLGWAGPGKIKYEEERRKGSKGPELGVFAFDAKAVIVETELSLLWIAIAVREGSVPRAERKGVHDRRGLQQRAALSGEHAYEAVAI